MNTMQDERRDPAFGQQCRTCGGRIDEGEGVFEETAEDAGYHHETCFTN